MFANWIIYPALVVSILFAFAMYHAAGVPYEQVPQAIVYTFQALFDGS